MLVKSKISAWPGSMPRTFIRDKMCVFMDGRKGDGTNTLTGFSHTFKNRETQMKLMSVLRKKSFKILGKIIQQIITAMNYMLITGLILINTTVSLNRELKPLGP